MKKQSAESFLENTSPVMKKTTNALSFMIEALVAKSAMQKQEQFLTPTETDSMESSYTTPYYVQHKTKSRRTTNDKMHTM